MGSTTFTIEVDVLDFLVKESNGRLSGLEAKPSSPEKMIHSILEDLKVRFSENLAQVFFFHNPKDYPQSMKVDQLEKKLIEKYNQSIEQCKKVISSRLSNFGISADEFIVQVNSTSQIIVQVYGEHDQMRLKKLLHSVGNLGFYETYEASEIFGLISNADTLISKNRELIHFADSASTTDTMILQHPLLFYIMPSIQKGNDGQLYYTKGSRFGSAKISDTSKINYYLRLKEVQRLFPADLKLLWAFKMDDGGSPEMISLYTIKSMVFTQPELKGTDIVQSHADFDQHNGSPIILFNFSEEAADRWYEMTKRNRDNSIAIVLDNKVISAPIVSDPISGGSSQISGQFTVEETHDISGLLGSNSLPFAMRIVDTKVVKPTK